MIRPTRVPVAVLALAQEWSLLILAIACLAFAPAVAQVAGAGVQRGAVIENECKLKNLRNTKSEVARSYIGKSCNFMGLSTASDALARQERTFHECVLEVIPGTEDDRNAVQLANACRERAWSR